MMHSWKRILGTGALALGMGMGIGATAVHAAPLTFDFKDAKGVNTVSFKLDAPLEAISGSASGISGEVTFDPTDPKATKGRIVVETASMQVPNSMMKGHMLGKDWMDVANHPQLSFEVQSVGDAKTTGDVTTAMVTGKLTLRGVTKTVTIPVKMTHLKDKLQARAGGQVKGDLLVLRSTFSVKRTDYGINPGAPQDKVSDDVELSLSVAGASPRK